LDVTLPPNAEMRFEIASRMLCIPRVDTFPALRADSAERSTDTALHTESARTDNPASVTDSTDSAFDSAEAACALMADASFEVTDPPATVEMRFESALSMLCIPLVETSPALRADRPLWMADTLFEMAFTTLVRFEISTDLTEPSAADTMLAAFEAAFATDSAFEAAFDTTDTPFATESTLADSAASVTESTESAFDKALAACADTAETSFDVTLPPPPALIRLDRAFRMLCIPRVDTSPTLLADIAERSTDTALHTESTRTESAEISTDFTEPSAALTTLAAFDAAFATESAFDATSLVVETRTSRAENSFDVTDAAPAPVDEILFDSALITACKPVADPPPADVADTLLTMDARWLTVERMEVIASEMTLPALNASLNLLEIAFRIDCKPFTELPADLIETFSAAERALAACADTALSSLDVTDTVTLFALILFDSALIAACNPVADPPPVDCAETLLTIDARWLTVEAIEAICADTTSPAENEFDRTLEILFRMLCNPRTDVPATDPRCDTFAITDTTLPMDASAADRMLASLEIAFDMTLTAFASASSDVCAATSESVCSAFQCDGRTSPAACAEASSAIATLNVCLTPATLLHRHRHLVERPVIV
jgi:hypothetical protein